MNSSVQKNNKTIWFDKPTNSWLESLPVGNGRIGAMVSGSVQFDKLQINEDSVWYGKHQVRDNPDALANLAKIRQLLSEGKQDEAERLAFLSLTSTPKYFAPFVPLAWLTFWFRNQKGNVTDYERSLNMETGTVTVKYSLNGVNYTREVFASVEAQALVMRFTADKPGALTIDVAPSRRPYEADLSKFSSDSIRMNGECGDGGVKYDALLHAGESDGEVHTIGDFVSINNASYATLYFVCNTTYRTDKTLEECTQQLKHIDELGYDNIQKMHIADFNEIFNRVEFSLKGSEEKACKPLNERLAEYKAGEKDDGLSELIFNMGRYLLISSSRKGTLPANLQGLWNDNFTPPWESKYTMNINVEMNYWPAETCGLGDCHEPLFDLIINKMIPNGRNTAKNVYGCKGWTAHSNSNLWGETGVDSQATPAAFWPMAGAWLSTHFWEHYKFTMDKTFLKEKAYPVMKEAAEFFEDYLICDKDGYLVTVPSVSPENCFFLDDSRISHFLTTAPSMDIELLNELFGACIEASEILDTDAQWRGKIADMKSKLRPVKIGSKGQVLEWEKEYKEHEPGHRHMSHLFGVYPGTTITQETDPALWKAAEVSVDGRLSNGSGGCGWSRAWIINLYARLLSGEKAGHQLSEFIKYYVFKNLFVTCESNEKATVFQADGNYGVTAGVAEMLIQSHNGYIELLPAVPASWKDGSARGFRARGGYVVDFDWEDGVVKNVKVKSDIANTCKIKYNGQMHEITVD